VCNRAASQALADGLGRIRAVAQRGSARLVGGEVESLTLQNTQLDSFIRSVNDLRTMTQDITANSVGLLQQQFALVAEMREQIFNPFVTTRKSGVGLGLAIVAKIIDGHGGTIRVVTGRGPGACFRVSFPAAGLAANERE